ncbi:MAG TPA: RraA family protein [Candidatus Methylomirabilis sp.]|nr:RraA family protein [Candidatus Methylomirabilis sp.]
MSSKTSALKDVIKRYKTLYTGAVADVLDRLGFRNQVLPYYIAPVTNDLIVAGPAFTGQGYPVADIANDDSQTRINMLESIKPDTVSVWSSLGHFESAHWGEIMSNAARERGCSGAVVDGGLRDTHFVLQMKFPVFCRFRCAASSIGRWEIKEWQIPVKIGNTVIRPDDFVFGDIDGVVVVPKEATIEVLEKTEHKVGQEKKMRVDLRKGVTVSEVYKKHGSF